MRVTLFVSSTISDWYMPYYLLMHRDMQHTPRVRAFADFVASEIKSFRALLSNGNVAGQESGSLVRISNRGGAATE